MKQSSDGFSAKCRKCYNEYAKKKYRERTKKLDKIYDLEGKSKVSFLPEPKIKKISLQQWKRDNAILCIIWCKNCGKIHEIRNKFNIYNCTCGKNIIYFTTINFLWSKLLYISDKIKNYSLCTFDPYK
jgi:hypothetical protein